MGDEWFSEDRDLRAAEEDFLATFNDAQIKASFPDFVKGFVKAYNQNKSLLLESEKECVEASKVKRDDGKYMDEFSRVVLACFSRADYLISDIEKSHKLYPNDYGRLLGEVLSAVEYGIVSTWFYDIEFRDQILGLVRSISINLKKLNKTVKAQFIRNRLIKIARKNKKIRADKKESIIRIAAVFG